MCGRFLIDDDAEIEEIYRIVDLIEKNFPSEKLKKGEIFPSDTAPILRGAENGKVILAEPAVWGFPKNGKGGSLVINARAETASERLMFAESLERRRCVIPSTGFFEWSHDAEKQKYLFRLPETKVLYMAGFYKDFDGVRRFVILTTSANASVSDVHTRMPVIISPQFAKGWLSDTERAFSYLRAPMPELSHTAV